MGCVSACQRRIAGACADTRDICANIKGLGDLPRKV